MYSVKQHIKTELPDITNVYSITNSTLPDGITFPFITVEHLIGVPQTLTKQREVSVTNYTFQIGVYDQTVFGIQTIYDRLSTAFMSKPVIYYDVTGVNPPYPQIGLLYGDIGSAVFIGAEPDQGLLKGNRMYFDVSLDTTIFF